MTVPTLSTPGAPAWETSPRAERARALLGEAQARLDAARAAAADARYTAALPDVLAAFRAALRAFLAWDGEEMDDDSADLDRLAGRAVRLSSVLKTPVHRALHLARRAPAIAQAGLLSVHDREDVETGWHTARNLLGAVRTVLPAALTATPEPAAAARPRP